MMIITSMMMDDTLIMIGMIIVMTAHTKSMVIKLDCLVLLIKVSVSLLWLSIHPKVDSRVDEL